MAAPKAKVTDNDGKALSSEPSRADGDCQGEGFQPGHTDVAVHVVDTEKVHMTLKASTEASSPFFLNDAGGDARGTTIHLLGDDQKLIQMMDGAFRKAASRKGSFGSVQTYTPQIVQCRLQNSGFYSKEDGYMFEGPFFPYISDMEKQLSELIQKALVSISHCSPQQQVQWYLSFLRTMTETNVQRPHIDFKWNDICPPVEGKGSHSRSFRGNYREWVPFIALFPVTRAGMTIEVWNARNDHQSGQEEKGVLVKIEHNSILLLRADVIHAGGFMDDHDGNPRAHLYIYKSDGVPHTVQVSNSYDVNIDGTHHDLGKFYKHNDQLLGPLTTVIPDFTVTSEQALLPIPNPVKKRLVQVPRKKLASQVPIQSQKKPPTITSSETSPKKRHSLVTHKMKPTLPEELFLIGQNIRCTVCSFDFGTDFSDTAPKVTTPRARGKRIERAFKRHAQEAHPNDTDYSFQSRKCCKVDKKLASTSGLLWFCFQPGLNLLRTMTKMSFDAECKNVMIALAAGVGASLIDVKRHSTVYF
jgi:hypothetical protein